MESPGIQHNLNIKMGNAQTCRKCLTQCFKRESAQNENIQLQQFDKIPDTSQSLQFTISPGDESYDQFPSESQRVDDQPKPDPFQYLQSYPTVQLGDDAHIKAIGREGVDLIQQLIHNNDGMEQVPLDDSLTIYFRSYQNAEKYNISVFQYTFTLPTTVQKYHAFISDLELQKSMDKQIDTYERPHGNSLMAIQYLRYKKILFMDPRDFLYVKYSDISQDRLVEVSKSVQMENFEPESQSKKKPMRANLLISGNLIEQVGENEIRVTTYSETDMRLKVNPQMTKKASCSELKKMIEKMKAYFNQ